MVPYGSHKDLDGAWIHGIVIKETRDGREQKLYGKYYEPEPVKEFFSYLLSFRNTPAFFAPQAPSPEHEGPRRRKMLCRLPQG